VGQKAQRSATPTADDVRLYSRITGDCNPLHVDAAFIAATRFQKLIVQGDQFALRISLIPVVSHFSADALDTSRASLM
jgi:acyl dehydratase